MVARDKGLGNGGREMGVALKDRSADVAAFRRGICAAPTSSLPVTEPTAQQAGAVGQSLWSVRASPRALWKVARQEVGVSLQPPAKRGHGQGGTRGGI